MRDTVDWLGVSSRVHDGGGVTVVARRKRRTTRIRRRRGLKEGMRHGWREERFELPRV